jgi:deoxyribodipyrimidine photo-lyase
MGKPRLSIFWFRRDLRIDDNAAFYHALKKHKAVLPVFIFDKTILNALADKKDRRVDFIYQALSNIQAQLSELGSSVYVFHDSPIKAFQKLLKKFEIESVYANHDYEPTAIIRDQIIADFLATNKISFNTYKDQCIFEKDEIAKRKGKPYTVFTRYCAKWKAKLSPLHYKPYRCKNLYSSLFNCKPHKIPTLAEMGFKKTGYVFKEPTVSSQLLKAYKRNRDFPFLNATSHLSVHLRYGTISVRQVVKLAIRYSDALLMELALRDFFMMILWNFPHVVTKPCRPEYEKIEWRNNEKEFEKWCRGKTGLPIVDAGMRELNESGFMQQRVRMIVASFLVKDLLIDWRWGEAYFGERLLDYDLSANNGNWQFAAGSGFDAAPYFRIINPVEQQKKFDPQFEYIKKWVPEFGTSSYPKPIVDHAQARLRAIQAYKKALSGTKALVYK